MNIYMKVLTITLGIIVLSLGILESSTKTYTFGIVPQQAARKLAQSWTPMLKTIELYSGVKLQFATAKDIPTFEKRLKEGKYDFAYMNPYHFVVYSKAPGYIALAKQKDKKIQGIIVVHKNSKITSIEELKENKLAFPAPAAFAASILPRAYMNEHNYNIKPFYVSSHDSVYRNVAGKIFIAGGGVKRTFNSVAPEIREQLRILWETPAYTPHAIAYHPDVEKNIADSVLAAMLKLNKEKNADILFEAIKFKAFSPAQSQDWDDIRNLKIDLLK